MARVAHLLGNGPSKAHFQCEPAGDVYGCNLGQSGVGMRATFISDFDVINHLDQNRIELEYPIIVIRRIENALRSRARFKHSPRPTILASLSRDLGRSENTGHAAFLWLIEQGYDEIHLWGFDSLKLNTVTSDTHTKLTKCTFSTRLIEPWRRKWKQLFSSENVRGRNVFLHSDVQTCEKVV